MSTKKKNIDEIVGQTPSGNGLASLAQRDGDKSRIDPIEGFKRVWRDNRYGGFSQGTSGQDSTPFLDALINAINEAHNVYGTIPHVVEGGAGAGYHSLTLVRSGFEVTAIEPSNDATNLMKKLRDQNGVPRRQLVVYNGAIEDYLSRLDGKSLNLFGKLKFAVSHLIGLDGKAPDAFYANSVLHFFKPEERITLYERLFTIQPEGGIVAVSFKANGDALQLRGNVVVEYPYGVVVRSHEDRIERLFVKNPELLGKELTNTGYELRKIVPWGVSGYNYTGQDSMFVGFIAQKPYSPRK